MQGVSVHDRNKWQMTATPTRLGQATLQLLLWKRGESSLTPHYYRTTTIASTHYLYTLYHYWLGWSKREFDRHITY